MKVLLPVGSGSQLGAGLALPGALLPLHVQPLPEMRTQRKAKKRTNHIPDDITLWLATAVFGVLSTLDVVLGTTNHLFLLKPMYTAGASPTTAALQPRLEAFTVAIALSWFHITALQE